MSVSEDINDVLIIDGVCITASDWHLLNGGRLEFYKKLHVVYNVTPRLYKGVKFVGRKKYCTAIVIGKLVQASNDFVKHVLVAGNPPNSIRNISSIVRNAFVKSVDQAFERLDTGCESRKAVKSLHCSYEKQSSAKEECYNEECRSKPIRIYPDDIVRFGDHFQACLRRHLHPYKLDVRLLVTRLGQSEKEQDAFRRLRQFNLHYAEQIVLHVARDFTMRGKCLLWNFLKLEDSFRRKLSYYGQAQKVHYSNVFLGGHGNLELNWTPLESFRSYTTEIQPVTVKYYTNTFKEFHRGQESTWRIPRVEESLTIISGFEKPDIQRVLELSRIKGRIESLREYCRSIAFASNNSARCEAILSLSTSEECKSTDDVLQKFKIFYSKMFSAGVRKSLNIFPYHEFITQIDDTIIVVLNNLEPIVNVTLEKRNSGTTLLSIPHTSQVLKAVVCEMLISFGIYGKLNHMAEGPKYRENIIRALRLRPSSFARQSITFNGLKYCRNLKLFIHDNNQILLYTGPVFLPYNAWQNLSNDITDQQLRDLNHILEELHNYRRKGVPNELIQLCIEKLPSIIWTACVNFAERHYFKKENFPDKTPQDIIGKATMENVEFITSLEFVNKLFFGNQELYQIGIARLAREILYQTDRIKAREISLSIAKHFEAKLLQSRALVLMYPVDKTCKQIYMILPLNGDKGVIKDTFIESPYLTHYSCVAERQYWILRLYQFALQRARKTSYCNLTGIAYIKTVLSDIAMEPCFNQKSTFMDILVGMEAYLCFYDNNC